MKNQKCSECGREIDLSKKLTKKEKEEDERVHGGLRSLEFMNDFLDNHRDYYCECGTRTTFLKVKGKYELYSMGIGERNG